MTLRIRPAAPADHGAMSRIASAAFDEPILTDPLSTRNDLILVADLAGAVVGFCGSFLTRSAAGQTRFELDLLAVDESARGRGAATALIADSLAQAPLHEADIIRGLARQNNHAMQRILQRAGLAQSQRLYRLYVQSLKPSDARAGGEHAAHLVRVDTLTYRGIWLEGELNTAAVSSARQIAMDETRSRIGAVIPAEDTATAALLRDCGLAVVGDYHWWTLNLRSAQS